MTLHIHRASSTDHLAEELAHLLEVPPDDPFARDLVVVPAKGIERWLTQRLSHHLGTGPRGGDGVCAAVDFLRPSSLVALLTGTERTDPWRRDRLLWAVLGVIDESIEEPWARPLALHLGAGHTGVEADLRRTRRYALARRLAGLFVAYAEQRPQLLTDWQAPQTTAGGLPDDLRWQPELWRRVVERVGVIPPDQRHLQTLRNLRDGTPVALPTRVSLFGHTRLARTEVELLEALAEHREVRLWLPEVSAALTQRLLPLVSEGPLRRSQDDSAVAIRHPLLASLGRDTRELTRTLALARSAVLEAPVAGPARPDTLLGWLQSDLAADTAPDADARAARVLREDDQSVQVHACHGAARQVEVLREVLVGLLQDDPTLEPRDIVVMCPDVEAYTPLIQASFGLGADAGAAAVGSHPAHRLRVRLADRAPAATNPLLGVAKQLISIASGRAEVSQMLDLIGAEPVRRRFGISDNDLDRLGVWIPQAGIRWGLTSRHRAPFGLDWITQNTWREGLDRVLLGVTMSQDDGPHVAGQTPLDAVSSGEIELAGKVAELIDRVQAGVDALTKSGPAPQWMAALRAAVASLTSVALRDAWMQAEFDRELVAVAEEGSGAEEVEIRLADVRSLLERRLEGRPTRSNFRTGTLTVCTLTPMRSVPHRVICLLGIDDGAFPRVTTIDGDDVLARAPMTGERDPRSEDRQLLLDAVLAAEQHLVITYSGASEHTGQERPPAVPVGEILDALDRTAAGPVRERIIHHHPLQAFSERNFTVGEPESLGTARPFSFDQTSLGGASARRSQTRALPRIAGEVGRPDVDFTIGDLQDFWRNPAKAFLKAHEIGVLRESDPPADGIPLDLDGLARWAIGDRMLGALAAGEPPEQVLAAELLRNDRPPGVIGERVLDSILGTANSLAQAASGELLVPAGSVEVNLELPSGSLSGYVEDLRGDKIIKLSYSSMSAKIVAGAWVEVLAAAAATGAPVSALLIARRGRSQQRVPLGPVSPDLSMAHLDTLLASAKHGLGEPVPVPVATGFVWAAKVGNAFQRKDALGKWQTERNSPMPGEQDDPAFRLLYGERAPIDVVIKAGLDQWANRLWAPLLPLTKWRG